MLTLKEYENKIIERLKEQVGEVEIISFPDNPAEYKLLHPKGALLVRFAGSDYEESEAEVLIRQVVKLLWDVVIVSRNLRNHYGAYDLLDKVRAALTGFEIAETRMFPVREDFLMEESGLWQYGSRFAFRSIHVE